MGLRWLLPSVLFLLCFSFLWWYTLGFSAFTVFTYTLKRAGTPPYPVPSLELVCHNGKRLNLSSLERSSFVNFIYLHCLYGCPISLAKMFRLGKDLPNGMFISVSVDPRRDSLEDLKERWKAMGGFKNWYFCKPADRDWGEKIRSLGVWVYRRKDGLINHTLDIFLIGGGKVLAVFPPEESVEEILREVKG